MTNGLIVKNFKLSNKKAAICLPIVRTTKSYILDEVGFAKNSKADLIEWRGDFFDDIENEREVLDCLSKINNLIPNVPVIFTLRSSDEGGCQELNTETRLSIYKVAINSGFVDFIDIEYINDDNFKEELIRSAVMNNVKIIMSYHDFNKTLKEEEILNITERILKYDIDIVKVAFQATTRSDVLEVLNAANTFTNKNADKYFIGISMGRIGSISRIAAGFFGSCITYASGREPSAKGQIPIGTLKKYIELFQ